MLSLREGEAVESPAEPTSDTPFSLLKGREEPVGGGREDFWLLLVTVFLFINSNPCGHFLKSVSTKTPS